MNRLDKQLPDLNDRSQNAGTPVVALLCLSVFGLSLLTVLPVCLSACLRALPICLSAYPVWYIRPLHGVSSRCSLMQLGLMDAGVLGDGRVGGRTYVLVYAGVGVDVEVNGDADS